MPVAYAMICCVIPYFIADPYMSANIIIQRMVANTESTSMMAAPFFIIAGAIMNYSGISKRIYDFAGALVGHLVGGLGHVNVIVSAMMGGISGSDLRMRPMTARCFCLRWKPTAIPERTAARCRRQRL